MRLKKQLKSTIYSVPSTAISGCPKSSPPNWEPHQSVRRSPLVDQTFTIDGYVHILDLHSFLVYKCQLYVLLDWCICHRNFLHKTRNNNFCMLSDHIDRKLHLNVSRQSFLIYSIFHHTNKFWDAIDCNNVSSKPLLFYTAHTPHPYVRIDMILSSYNNPYCKICKISWSLFQHFQSCSCQLN